MPSIGPDDAALHPGQIGDASPALFDALIDDAAVFPPRGARLDEAVQEHVAHLSADYGRLLGPLVIRPEQVLETAKLVATQGFTDALPIALVASGGLDEAREGLRLSRLDPTVRVVAVELPLDSVDDLRGAWSELGADGRAVWWEIDRRGYLREQLGRLAGANRPDGRGGAKVRTGGADPSDVPGEDELAAFLRHAIDLDLSFKLTAGLHHAVRGSDDAAGLEHHGVLNVLCAVRAALNGAEEVELAQVLAERDPDPLVTKVNTMSEADAAVLRAFWSSFGCCDVTEPIGELALLGLLDPDRSWAPEGP